MTLAVEKMKSVGDAVSKKTFFTLVSDGSTCDGKHISTALAVSCTCVGFGADARDVTTVIHSPLRYTGSQPQTDVNMGTNLVDNMDLFIDLERVVASVSDGAQLGAVCAHTWSPSSVLALATTTLSLFASAVWPT